MRSVGSYLQATDSPTDFLIGPAGRMRIRPGPPLVGGVVRFAKPYQLDGLLPVLAAELTATVWPPAWKAVDKDLAFNEIAPAGTPADEFWLELVNYGSTFVDVGQYVIVSSTGEQYVLPTQTLSPGEFLEVKEAQLGFHPADEDRLTLLNSNRATPGPILARLWNWSRPLPRTCPIRTFTC